MTAVLPGLRAVPVLLDHGLRP